MPMKLWSQLELNMGWLVLITYFLWQGYNCHLTAFVQPLLLRVDQHLHIKSNGINSQRSNLLDMWIVLKRLLLLSSLTVDLPCAMISTARIQGMLTLWIDFLKTAWQPCMKLGSSSTCFIKTLSTNSLGGMSTAMIYIVTQETLSSSGGQTVFLALAHCKSRCSVREPTLNML